MHHKMTGDLVVIRYSDITGTKDIITNLDSPVTLRKTRFTSKGLLIFDSFDPYDALLRTKLSDTSSSMHFTPK